MFVVANIDWSARTLATVVAVLDWRTTFLDRNWYHFVAAGPKTTAQVNVCNGMPRY